MPVIYCICAVVQIFTFLCVVNYCIDSILPINVCYKHNGMQKSKILLPFANIDEVEYDLCFVSSNCY
jgi:hypothetical protein